MHCNYFLKSPTYSKPVDALDKLEFTMGRTGKKAARAKLQRTSAQGKFISGPTQCDGESDYEDSGSDSDASVSSTGSLTVARQLYAKKFSVQQNPMKCKQPVAVEDCAKLERFGFSRDTTLMRKDTVYNPETEDVDVEGWYDIEEAITDMDLMEFCISCTESGPIEDDELDEQELQNTQKDLAEAVAGEDEDLANDEAMHTAEVEAAREWLVLDDDDSALSQKNIFEIVKTCLKEVKRLKTSKKVKMMTQLTAVTEYAKLHERYAGHPKCQRPALNASLAIAYRMGKGPYFARQIRENARYLLRHQRLPLSLRSAQNGQYMLLDDENVLQVVRSYLAAQAIGTITPFELCRHVNNVIIPTLDLTGKKSTICERIAIRWLGKLGYQCRDVKKGLYYDGHERPDVVEARTKYLEEMKRLERLMCKYDDDTLEPIPPELGPGKKEHVVVMLDESIVGTNESAHRCWLKEGEQPLRRKGNGRGVHICGYICETVGQLKLSDEQITEQLKLLEDQRLKVTDSCKIIYPGKNHDTWWDLQQLMDQTVHAIDIFEYLHPNKVGIWVFNCSSAHEGLAHDALNVNNMNINTGGKQRSLRTTIIPLNNPPPLPGKDDTRGRPQSMVFPADHPNEELRNKPKGMQVVLQEHESVWDELMKRSKAGKPVGKCKECKMSEVKKDAARRVAEAEAMGQEDAVPEDDVAQADQPDIQPVSDWCCMYRVLSLQDDFANEKPMLQKYIEGRGHICMYLPKFHCELNPIEMLWGFMKYRYRKVSDGKFSTAKVLVPQCLNMCDTITIRRFFCKTWRYMDSYSKGLDAYQTAFAVKVFKSHRRVGHPAEIKALMSRR
ncbi:hypothetical protein SERLADRAFT_443479 [Serpula lacrymans var. lacrymans S7.9]|nr:uncharacterized protein SERLADRAFT_443479 [Serpula lacrymans var. lacrymans S7.9]EGO18931.1 hypothetical protein SERLADRAFT_443479 [Serpula lacrymans var. lacrymans S7.9]